MVLIWGLLGWLGLPGAVALAKAPEHADVRLLIDISGSMRQNDPQNLRRPALRMLVGLMQPGTRAGVWTFARWVNMLVEHGDVDEAWKKHAIALSDQIASPGQFTNIEEAMESAARGWEGGAVSHSRHLVVLTDGMVDVSKTPGENAASRQRILGDLLPQLQAKGVKVHAIALSARADHALLKALAGATDGWYEQVDSADRLQRIFLRIFEQVGKPDALPLKDNRFTVDASIREATVVLFRLPGSEPAVLISPTGERYTGSDLPAGIAWFSDQGYDLITLATPKKGEWSLQADVDPDNRVMVVTDLKLETSEIPAHLAAGERIPVSAYLSSRGEMVTRKAFLEILDVRAFAMGETGSDPQGLNDRGEDGDDVAGDGRYSMLYSEQRAFDRVELLFSVESATFMREKRHRIAVHEAATLSVEPTDNGPQSVIRIDTAVMQDGVVPVVWQQHEQQGRMALEPVAGGVAGLWSAPLADPALPVYAALEGNTRNGNLIAREYGPVFAPGSEPAVAPPVMMDVDPIPVVAPVADEPAAAPTIPPTAPPSDSLPPAASVPATAGDGEEGDWLLPVLALGVGNLILFGGGGAVWWFLRRRRKAGEVDLLGELDGGDLGDLGDDPDATVLAEQSPGRKA